MKRLTYIVVVLLLTGAYVPAQLIIGSGGQMILGANPAIVDGNTRSGVGVPTTPDAALNGDFYTDTSTGCLWGPKAAGAWPGSAAFCPSTSPMVFPAQAGIPVCTGTPCTAWTTSFVPPSSSIVGISDTQTLTNKSINGSEINSGTVPPAFLPLPTASAGGVVRAFDCATLGAGYVTQKIGTDGIMTCAVASGAVPSNSSIKVATTTVLPTTIIYSNGTAGVGATITAGTSNSTLVVDGYTLLLNDVIMVKDQASGVQNGIYTLTQLATVGVPWVLTRSVDRNTPGNLNNAGMYPILSGSVNGGSSWVQTSKVTTIGTDALVFALFAFNPASPPAIGGTTPAVGTFTNLLTKVSPMADIRAYGGDCTDGIFDNTAAVQATAAALGENGGTIYFPGPNCYIANPTGITWRTGVNSRSIELKVSGSISVGSTFINPGNMDLGCAGGTYAGQFNTNGPNCGLTGPNARGTLGTAVTSTGSQTVTPTYVAGSIANIKVGSYLTIAGNTTCNISTVSRDSSGFVTVTLSANQCRIPPGASIQVAGVADTSFNIPTSAVLIGSDYPAGTMRWKQTNTAVASSTGGTVTGLNDDTFETVRVTAVSGSNVTALFHHLHAAADKWGPVTYGTAPNQFGTNSIHGLNIIGNYGAGVYQQQSTNITWDGLNINAMQWASSVAMHLDGAYSFHLTHSNLSHWDDGSQPGCAGTCAPGEIGYPYGLKLSADNPDGGIANGLIDGFTTIWGGIKVDCNGVTNQCSNQGVTLDHVILEEPAGDAISVDPRGLGSVNKPWVLRKVFLQDLFTPYAVCLMGYTDPPAGAKPAKLFMYPGTASDLSDCLTNKYWDMGALAVFGYDDYNGSIPLPRHFGRTATMLDGITIEGELRGIGAGMSPAIIPYATQNVTTDPTAWTCTGTGCSITTGVLAPDGTPTAAELFRGSAVSKTQVFGSNFATATGDWFIIGVWTMNGTNVTTNNGANSGMSLSGLNAGDVFDNSSAGWSVGDSSRFSSSYNHDWWYPVVAARKITGAGFSSHNIQMYLENGTATSGNGMRFWMPFLIRVPYSAKPAAWTDDQWDTEIARWRQQLLHGAVPPNMPAGVLAINPSLKMYWGSDTNLYRDGTNGLKTDNTLNASVLQQNGAGIATVAKGAATGLVGAWGCTEGSGTSCADSGPNNNALTITSGTWSGTSAPLTNSVVFNGSSTRLDAATQRGTNFTNTTPFSVSTWINLGSSASGALFSTSDTSAGNKGWEISTESCSGNCINVWLINTYGSNWINVQTSASAYTTAAWHNIVVTYDGSSTAAGVKVYVDGVSKALTVIADTLTGTIANTKTLRMGMRTEGTQLKLPNNTKMGATSLWNRVLAAADIMVLYNSPYGWELQSEFTAHKDIANGYAGLDGAAKLSGAEIPATVPAEYNNGTCTTAKTIDPVNGTSQKVTLTNAQTCALTFTQPTSSTANVNLKIIQSAVSTFNGLISGCKWPGAVTPTITATTGAIDLIHAYLDGTTTYCNVIGQDVR